MADIDFSLLDVPRSAPVANPEAYLRTAIAWHFGPDTGSPFWLRTARTLDFDPLTEVNTFADLRLFPNVVNELRSVPTEELIPRLRHFAAPATGIRVRRYHRPPQANGSDARLDRTGDPVAD